jgi:hypothetical protein
MGKYDLAIRVFRKLMFLNEISSMFYFAQSCLALKNQKKETNNSWVTYFGVFRCKSVTT